MENKQIITLQSACQFECFQILQATERYDIF